MFEGLAKFADLPAPLDHGRVVHELLGQQRGQPLGLDRHPELKEMYFGAYERLLYIAQTDDPVLTEKARAGAELLGLAFERRLTGYGDLSPAMRHANRLVKTPQS